MKTYLILIFSIYLIGCSSSSNNYSSVNVNYFEVQELSSINNITGDVETMPYPKGGIESIQNKVSYPYNAKLNNIQGMVTVSTWIDSLGIVNKVALVSGIGYGCDEVAMRAIKLTKFIPGKINGKPVSVIIQIPISFKLQ